MQNKRFRNICFTVNNYSEVDIIQLKQLYENNLVNYIIYGFEVAPTTNTRHLQGYCQFIEQIRFKPLQKLFPHGTHIESAKGNFISNKNYCSKSGIYNEFGEPKKQGKRNDLSELKLMVNDNIPFTKILDECNNLQQIKYVEKLFTYKNLNPINKKKEVIYLTGDSGSGKTFLAYQMINPNNYWRSNDTLVWFDGYCGQDHVIIDDFRSKNCSFSFLLTLLDEYQIRVPIKGGFVIWNPTKIIITSIKAPWELYDSEDEDMFQLYRRLNKVFTVANRELVSEVEGNTIPQLLEPGFY